MDNLTPYQLERIRLRLEQWSHFNGYGCRIWKGSLTSTGYGQLSITVDGRKRPEKAHRVSWRVHRGPIPEGMCVCHECDNTLCIYEDHLFLGTKADNSEDMAQKGRAHGGYKLTDAEVEQVRQLLDFGVRQQEIADAYGVSRPLVSMIKSGRAHFNIGHTQIRSRSA